MLPPTYRLKNALLPKYVAVFLTSRPALIKFNLK